jgi:ligand-binding sensor domain-containing protein
MRSKHFYLQLSFFCRCFIYLSSLYFLYVLPAQAQYEENDFVRYTVKEGLSHNYVTCLQQDDWGYMWIGTDLGLNRFTETPLQVITREQSHFLYPQVLFVTLKNLIFII